MLRLDLPRLGGVYASIAIVQGGAHIALQAGSAEAASVMNAQIAILTNALQTAGIAPLNVTVREHDQA